LGRPQSEKEASSRQKHCKAPIQIEERKRDMLCWFGGIAPASPASTSESGEGKCHRIGFWHPPFGSESHCATNNSKSLFFFPHQSKKKVSKAFLE